MKIRLLLILLIFFSVCYLLTGLTAVSPGSAVVVRRLGRTLPKAWTQGPHWGLPLGFETRTRVRIDEVRRLEIGGGSPASNDDEFLTGDLNLLKVRAAVQYRVSDPVAFVLKADDVESLLATWSEACLSRALATREIDTILREGRSNVVLETQTDLSKRVVDSNLGVSILSVSLTEVRPPDEVAADFAAAQSAGGERDRRINEANTQAATTLARARAQASSRIELSRAAADRSRLIAQARADRFETLLVELRRDRRATMHRIHLETLRELLPKVRRKLLLAPDEPIDLSIFHR